MAQDIFVNVTPQEVRVALAENSVVQEIYIERQSQQSLVGNIYQGRVNRFLPGIQAAFIDIGLEKGAFLAISDMTGHQDSADIRELLTIGQTIAVQIYKDPIGGKGARATTQFTIPARYLVFTPGAPLVTISQKITDENERQRLSNVLSARPDGGYIFRTAAAGIAEEDILRDKMWLDHTWADIEARQRQMKPITMIYRELPIVQRLLRDWVKQDVNSIRVDHVESVQMMQSFAGKYIPALVNRIEYHESSQPIFDLYGIEHEIQKLLSRKIFLKSGGYIVFDQTEAMTTIDINTGSCAGQRDLKQTAFNINMEAIDVIVRQIRLRNLGGIIVIDFIDMVDDTHKKQLLMHLTAALQKDSAKIQISELSRLGLIQITRKRIRESIEKILCESCPNCHGRGSLKSVETMCYEVFRQIQRIAQRDGWIRESFSGQPEGLLVMAAPAVARELLEKNANILAGLEARLGRRIAVRAEVSYTQEQFEVLPLMEHKGR